MAGAAGLAGGVGTAVFDAVAVGVAVAVDGLASFCAKCEVGERENETAKRQQTNESSGMGASDVVGKKIARVHSTLASCSGHCNELAAPLKPSVAFGCLDGLLTNVCPPL